MNATQLGPHGCHGYAMATSTPGAPDHPPGEPFEAAFAAILACRKTGEFHGAIRRITYGLPHEHDHVLNVLDFSRIVVNQM